MRRLSNVYYYNPTFKQLFPNWEVFKKYLIDFAVYFDKSEYTDKKALIYFTILYRQYANSNIAYDYEVFLEKLSLVITENFREFFKITELLDYVNTLDVEELIQGVETITNVAQNPNIDTDKNTILNYIGTQSRSRSTENVIDRVYTAVRNIKVNEIMNEVVRFEHLFVQVPPSNLFTYGDDHEGVDFEYVGKDD